MTPTKLEELQSLVAPKIENSSVRLDPEQCLCFTLRYLLTGDPRVTIAASYRISPTSTGRIIKETTCAIWDVLLERGYLQPPQSSKDWESISRGFENRRNYSHCVAALDGKHVAIQASSRITSIFLLITKRALVQFYLLFVLLLINLLPYILERKTGRVMVDYWQISA